MSRQRPPGDLPAPARGDADRHAAVMAAHTLRGLAEVAKQLVSDPPAGTPHSFAGQCAAMMDAVKAQAVKVAAWLNGPAASPADPGGWDADRHAASVAAMSARCLLEVAEQLVMDAPHGTPTPYVDHIAAMVDAMHAFSTKVEGWFNAQV